MVRICIISIPFLTFHYFFLFECAHTPWWIIQAFFSSTTQLTFLSGLAYKQAWYIVSVTSVDINWLTETVPRYNTKPNKYVYLSAVTNEINLLLTNGINGDVINLLKLSLCTSTMSLQSLRSLHDLGTDLSRSGHRRLILFLGYLQGARNLIGPFISIY